MAKLRRKGSATDTGVVAACYSSKEKQLTRDSTQCVVWCGVTYIDYCKTIAVSLRCYCYCDSARQR